MRKCHTWRIPIYLVFLFTIAFHPAPLIAQVQSSGGGSKKAPASPVPTGAQSGPSSSSKGPSGTQSGKPTNVSIQSKLAADALVFSDAGDYVPCEFSRADLLGLRPQPDVFTLSSADEETLRARIIADALDNENAGAFTPNQRDAFVQDVAAASYVGLTPSQATGKTLFLLAQNTAAPLSVSDLLKWSANSNEQFADYLDTHFSIDSKTVMAQLGAVEQPPETKLAIAAKVAKDKIATASPTSSSLLSAAAGNNQDFAQFFNNLYNVDITAALGNKERPEESKLDIASQTATATKQTAAETDTAQAKELASAANLVNDASASQTLLKSVGPKNQIAQSVQQTTSTITRPVDVGCSMSILSYETTRYAFGQKIADEFIPIQIVVRNLNKDQEFLVHDAEVAVDADINGERGRYSSGVDKLTARTFMLAAKDYDHRSLTVHIAQGIGIVLSSASLVYGPAVKDASNVFNQGFLTALTGVWTDHSTDQLNLLNDEGFSSYRTERTVVPKTGTAEFVIFVRSDLFQQGWWTQDCAENIVLKTSKVPGQLGGRQMAKCLGQFNLMAPDPKCFASPEIGVDLEAARRVCIHYYKSPDNQSSEEGNGSGEPNLIEIGKDDELKGDLAYFRPKSVPYKKWSPIAQALFRELSIAVVAGTHIQEQANTTSALTKIDCPTNDQGDIDFDKADNANLVCTLTGNNLDTVQTLKLRNSADATDTTTANATVTTTSSGGAKTTKASFTLDSLGKLPGTLYKVSTVTQAGVETPTDQLLHLSDLPYLPASGKPDPTSVNIETLLSNNAKPIPITIKGYHLDTLESVQFAKAPDDKSKGSVTPFKISVDQGATASQAQVTMTTANVKSGNISGDFTSQSLELSISLISKKSPNTPIATKQVLYGTGKVTAASSVPAGGAKSSVSLSAKTLSFGPQSIGTTSAAKSLTLTNQGSSPLTQIAVKVSGATPDDFVPENNPCNGTVEAKGKCSITAQFKPSKSGKISATFSITYVLGGAEQAETVSLTGTGTVPGPDPTVTVSAKSLSFGPQKKGTPSGEKPITVTNAESTSLTQFEVKITGTNANSFTEKNTCGSAIAAGGKCTVTIQFAPLSATKVNATLSITYTVDGTRKMQSVSLLGAGTE